MTFSYNLITTALNSKGTLSFSSLFHKLFLGTVSKDFLKSTKQQNRRDLLLWNSSAMILSVTRWSVVKWFLPKPAWSSAYLPSISSHVLIFFSKIIPYNLAKRGIYLSHSFGVTDIFWCLFWERVLKSLQGTEIMAFSYFLQFFGLIFFS